MVDKFKALAEESRLRILALLLDGELCVCEIESALGMTQSNASRHLTALKKCGILESRKDAQWAYYSISPKFKQEDEQLWTYLSVNLKKQTTYSIDHDSCEKNRQNNMCSCRQNKEE